MTRAATARWRFIMCLQLTRIGRSKPVVGDILKVGCHCIVLLLDTAVFPNRTVLNSNVFKYALAPT
jgi:hypothetical protein